MLTVMAGGPVLAVEEATADQLMPCTVSCVERVLWLVSPLMHRQTCYDVDHMLQVVAR